MNELLCSLCHSPIAQVERATRCEECGAVSHEECLEENRGCGSYGCSKAPPPPVQAVPVPATSVWGIENKTCPSCGKEIRSAALRCRFCGAQFDTAEPMTKEEMALIDVRKREANALGRAAPAIFFGGLIPCFVPVVICVGGPFVLTKRFFLAYMPPLRRLLVYLGFAISFLWIVLAAIVLLAG